MKGKTTMILCIGGIAMILTVVILTQFKTIDKTDITAIETMRETELRAELSSWKEKYEDLEEKIADRENKIQEYKTEKDSNANISLALENEVKEAEAFLGMKELKGEGLVITLTNEGSREITYSDLLGLVNELKIAGAEAITINDERIVSMTEITLVNFTSIMINSSRVSAPYTVKVIGDKKYLESALTIKNGFFESLKDYGKNVSYTVDDNIVLKAYQGKQVLKYATEKVENKEEK